MGKSTIPTYYAEARDNTSPEWKHMVWDCKQHGRPTHKNVERYRVSLNESFQIGNVNDHISKAAGFLVHTSAVRVIRNRTGEVVVEAKAPLFEILPALPK